MGYLEVIRQPVPILSGVKHFQETQIKGMVTFSKNLLLPYTAGFGSYVEEVQASGVSLRTLDCLTFIL
jgi:hypothetical protein